MDREALASTLEPLSPGKRLKYLRQKIVQKNQDDFCQDGIIRAGTLKLIESNRLKISPRIAVRLTHKFRLEGVSCEPDLFFEDNNNCNVAIDNTRQNIIGSAMSSLEELRIKISTLTPISISKEICPSLLPNGGIALARELKQNELQTLNNTLCLIHGTQLCVSYLTYDGKQLLSKCEDKIEYFSTHIIHICGIYVIEMLSFH